MAEETIEWTEVNLEKLIDAVAEVAWHREIQIKEVPATKVYNLTVLENGEVSKEVTPEWAQIYWQMREGYMELAQSYIRK